MSRRPGRPKAKRPTSPLPVLPVILAFDRTDLDTVRVALERHLGADHPLVGYTVAKTAWWDRRNPRTPRTTN